MSNIEDLKGEFVHCLNCLNGNIDGVVISIDKDIEKAQTEADKEDK